jgi:hypothetical protein
MRSGNGTDLAGGSERRDCGLPGQRGHIACHLAERSICRTKENDKKQRELRRENICCISWNARQKRKYNTISIDAGHSINKNQLIDAERPYVGWPAQPEKKRG